MQPVAEVSPTQQALLAEVWRATESTGAGPDHEEFYARHSDQIAALDELFAWQLLKNDESGLQVTSLGFLSLPAGTQEAFLRVSESLYKALQNHQRASPKSSVDVKGLCESLGLSEESFARHFAELRRFGLSFSGRFQVGHPLAAWSIALNSQIFRAQSVAELISQQSSMIRQQIQSYQPRRAAGHSSTLTNNQSRDISMSTLHGWRKGKRIGSGGGAEGVYEATRRDEAGADIEALSDDLGEKVVQVMRPGIVDDRRKWKEDFFEIVCRVARLANIPEEVGALKVYVRDGDPDLDAIVQDRVKREVRAMQELAGNPHSIRLLDHEIGPRPWIVTEYHRAGSLAEEPMRQRFKGDFVGALRALQPIADVLADIHSRGWVHRDIAPKNIFVSSTGSFVLGDWGIVRRDDPEITGLTQPGQVMGTKDMMPAWVRNKSLKEWPANADVYSWGKTLWMLIDGGIEPVPREYWKEDEYNLMKRFAGTRGIAQLDEILARTVVERPDACLKDGAALLELVNQVLRDIEGGFVRPGHFGGQSCRVCGEGKYIESDSPSRAGLWSHVHQARHLVQLGLQEQRWIIAAAACSQCGHAEYFVWPPKGPASVQDLTEGLLDSRVSVRACCAANLESHQDRSAERVAEALAKETNLHVRLKLIQLLSRSGRHARALEVLDKIATSDPDPRNREEARLAAVEMRKRPA